MNVIGRSLLLPQFIWVLLDINADWIAGNDETAMSSKGLKNAARYFIVLDTVVVFSLLLLRRWLENKSKPEFLAQLFVLAPVAALMLSFIPSVFSSIRLSSGLKIGLFLSGGTVSALLVLVVFVFSFSKTIVPQRKENTPVPTNSDANSPMSIGMDIVVLLLVEFQVVFLLFIGIVINSENLLFTVIVIHFGTYYIGKATILNKIGCLAPEFRFHPRRLVILSAVTGVILLISLSVYGDITTDGFALMTGTSPKRLTKQDALTVSSFLFILLPLIIRLITRFLAWTGSMMANIRRAYVILGAMGLIYVGGIGNFLLVYALITLSSQSGVDRSSILRRSFGFAGIVALGGIAVICAVLNNQLQKLDKERRERLAIHRFKQEMKTLGIQFDTDVCREIVLRSVAWCHHNAPQQEEFFSQREPFIAWNKVMFRGFQLRLGSIGKRFEYLHISSRKAIRESVVETDSFQIQGIQSQEYQDENYIYYFEPKPEFEKPIKLSVIFNNVINLRNPKNYGLEYKKSGFESQSDSSSSDSDSVESNGTERQGKSSFASNLTEEKANSWFDQKNMHEDTGSGKDSFTSQEPIFEEKEELAVVECTPVPLKGENVTPTAIAEPTHSNTDSNTISDHAELSRNIETTTGTETVTEPSLNNEVTHSLSNHKTSSVIHSEQSGHCSSKQLDYAIPVDNRTLPSVNGDEHNSTDERLDIPEAHSTVGNSISSRSTTKSELESKQLHGHPSDEDTAIFDEGLAQRPLSSIYAKGLAQSGSLEQTSNEELFDENSVSTVFKEEVCLRAQYDELPNYNCETNLEDIKEIDKTVNELLKAITKRLEFSDKDCEKILKLLFISYCSKKDQLEFVDFERFCKDVNLSVPGEQVAFNEENFFEKISSFAQDEYRGEFEFLSVVAPLSIVNRSLWRRLLIERIICRNTLKAIVTYHRSRMMINEIYGDELLEIDYTRALNVSNTHISNQDVSEKNREVTTEQLIDDSTTIEAFPREQDNRINSLAENITEVLESNSNQNDENSNPQLQHLPNVSNTDNAPAGIGKSMEEESEEEVVLVDDQSSGSTEDDKEEMDPVDDTSEAESEEDEQQEKYSFLSCCRDAFKGCRKRLFDSFNNFFWPFAKTNADEDDTSAVKDVQLSTEVWKREVQAAAIWATAKPAAFRNVTKSYTEFFKNDKTYIKDPASRNVNTVNWKKLSNWNALLTIFFDMVTLVIPALTGVAAPDLGSAFSSGIVWSDFVAMDSKTLSRNSSTFDQAAAFLTVYWSVSALALSFPFLALRGIRRAREGKLGLVEKKSALGTVWVPASMFSVEGLYNTFLRITGEWGFFSMVRVLASAFVCNHGSEPPVLEFNENIQCWRWEHGGLLLLGIVSSFSYIPVCVFLLPNFQFQDASLDIKYAPTFMVFVTITKLVFAGSSALITERSDVIPVLLVNCGVGIALYDYVLKHQPCLINFVNTLRVVSLSLVIAIIVGSIATSIYAGIWVYFSSIGMVLFILAIHQCRRKITETSLSLTSESGNLTGDKKSSLKEKGYTN